MTLCTEVASDSSFLTVIDCSFVRKDNYIVRDHAQAMETPAGG